jgi:hypothetical protein
MATPPTPAPLPERRRWLAPQLIKHESLTVLTRQQYDPVTGQPVDPYALPPQSASDIGGSSSVFVPGP